MMAAAPLQSCHPPQQSRGRESAGARAQARGAYERALMAAKLKGVRTTVSIPDSVFEKAERLVKRTKKSRSQLYSDALKEYLARHAPDEVTEAMDRVLAGVENSADPFVSIASQRALKRSEW